ncbi:hypothetical protein BC940DRAFT_299197 [Gongronella butleri]|nr:hypothetical protein BC940DRAFT_299197 [Gongronella butleri]
MATVDPQSLSLSEADDTLDDNYSDDSYRQTPTRKRAASQSKRSRSQSKTKAKRKSRSTTPHKKPGRKPIAKLTEEDSVNDPKAKRREQNREAQRNFRERKEKFVGELQERIRQLEEEKSAKEIDLEMENASLKEQVAKLKEQLKEGAPFTFDYPLPSHPPSSQPLASPPLSNSPPSSASTQQNQQKSQEQQLSPASSDSSMGTLSTPTSSTYDGSSQLVARGQTESNAMQMSMSSASASDFDTSHSGPFQPDAMFAPDNLFDNLDPLTNFELAMDASAGNANGLPPGLDTPSLLFGTSLTSQSQSQHEQQQQHQQHQPSQAPSSFFAAQPQAFTIEDQLAPLKSEPQVPTSFLNYRNPPSAVDDWLLQDVTGLLSSTADTNVAPTAANGTLYPDFSLLPLNSGLVSTPPALPLKCKLKIIGLIEQAKDQGKNRREVKEHVNAVCPDYDMDFLCRTLRAASLNYDPEKPFSDGDLSIIKGVIQHQ